MWRLCDLLLMFSAGVAIEQRELTEGLACTSPCAGQAGVGLYSKKRSATLL